MQRVAKIYASIQEISTGRVYVILLHDNRFYWLRAMQGRDVFGPFLDLNRLFTNMAQVEGKSAEHWHDAFMQFQSDAADIPVGSSTGCSIEA